MRESLFGEHRGAPERGGLQSIRVRGLRLVGLLSRCRDRIIMVGQRGEGIRRTVDEMKLRSLIPIYFESPSSGATYTLW